MSDSTRQRIAASFDRELSGSPVPPGLRSQAVHSAVLAPPREDRQPRLLALVAALVALAIIATLVIGSHVLRTTPTPAKPSQPPPPRTDASVVYDGAHKQLLVFGGSTERAALLDDTWTWDGKTWTDQHPAARPQARMGGAVAYDEARHVVVLFGGWAEKSDAQAQSFDPDDTWTWNGSTWREQHPSHKPAFDFSSPATMGFDPLSRSVLLYGFATINTGSLTAMRAQTWSWNGSDWRQLNPAGSPQSDGDMFSDGKHLFLTTPPFDAGAQVQMSEWDGSSWTPVDSQNALPMDSGLMSAAFDVKRDQLVVLDGDTWTWDRSRWVRQHPQQQPPTGNMTYFAPLHEVISWGERWGVSSNTVWGWNGTDWTVITAGTVPPAPTPSGQFGPTTPAAAEAFIRQTVRSSSPVLLPTWLPDGVEAQVEATADGFTVTYRTDQRDKQIYFGIVVANPPPAGGAHAASKRVKFRNAIAPKFGQSGEADYVVYDTTNPYSQRYLSWTEPGSMTNPQVAGPGVPYFLSTSGLTDQEFWQVANSLR